MANDIIYFSTRQPIVDDNGLITQSWARYFENVGQKAQVIDGTVTLTAAAGTATALPALPAGYMTINIDGVKRKVPFYL